MVNKQHGYVGDIHFKGEEIALDQSTTILRELVYNIYHNELMETIIESYSVACGHRMCIIIKTYAKNKLIQW